MSDVDAIIKIVQGGSTALLAIACVVLWRQYLAQQAKYEAILRETITVLVQVKEHLEEREWGQQPQLQTRRD